MTDIIGIPLTKLVPRLSCAIHTEVIPRTSILNFKKCKSILARLYRGSVVVVRWGRSRKRRSLSQCPRSVCATLSIPRILQISIAFFHREIFKTVYFGYPNLFFVRNCDRRSRFVECAQSQKIISELEMRCNVLAKAFMHKFDYKKNFTKETFKRRILRAFGI